MCSLRRKFYRNKLYFKQRGCVFLTHANEITERYEWRPEKNQPKSVPRHLRIPLER